VTIQAVAAAYNRHQATIAARANARTAAQWATIDPADISGSWAAGVSPAMVTTLTAAQQLAAASAPAYVQAALGAQSVAYDPAATISPAGFSGVAADGRALSSLLYLPVIAAKQALAGGIGVDEALAVGGRTLSMLTVTETADAGRNALQAQMSATPTVHGYVRMVAGSACSRCIILAGRWYRYNASFLRHPQCQCTGIPAAENSKDLRTDPHSFFEHLSPAEQDARFGIAGARAIRDGADIFQVVNAQRGLYQTRVFGRDVQATFEGMGRHGVAGKKLAGATKGLRLTVGQIYADAGEDRDLALSLLHRYAYIH